MSDVNEDRDALLAAMYDIEDEPEQPAGPKPERPNGIMNLPLVSSKIRKMESIIEEQDRLIKRLSQRVRNLEKHSNKMTLQMNQMDSELDTKISRSGV